MNVFLQILLVAALTPFVSFYTAKLGAYAWRKGWHLAEQEIRQKDQ